jgi:hypothetical protein
MEEMKVGIVVVYTKEENDLIKELFYEVLNKFNKSNYLTKSYVTSTSQPEFMDIFWLINDVVPNGMDLNIKNMVLQSVKEKTDYDLVLFLNPNILPLTNESIDYMVDSAKNAQIACLGLYDSLAISKQTYTKMGAPKNKELFNIARDKKFPVNTMIVSSIDSVGNKTFKNFKNQELFWQSSDVDQFRLKCEELLTKNIYEDRSIKH